MQSTDMKPMLQLKEETRLWHDKLEQHAQSHKIMNMSITAVEYSRLMHFHYLLHHILEPQIMPLIDQHWPELQFSTERSKLNALQSDLNQLKIPVSEDAFEHMNMASPFAALGAAYVLEGSTLGGQVILRHLKQNPNVSDLEAFHFYSLYGDQVGQRWKAFSQHCNEVISNSEARQEASEGAVATFKLACDILERHPISP